MPEIRFEGPPPRQRQGRSSEASAIAETLKTRRGEWAVVRVADRASITDSLASYIRTGKSSVFAPAGSFEAVSRKIEGEHRVYARYVGAEAGGHRA